MNATVAQHVERLTSNDRDVQGKAYRFLMKQTRSPVNWAYDVWDELLNILKNGDNRARSISGQLLCNLAKSDPEERIVHDFNVILEGTRDERFVTARHILQSLWKIGVVNDRYMKLTRDGLKVRYKECEGEKASRIIRDDIINMYKKMHEQVGDESLMREALALIEMESNKKYQKKYLNTWKDLRSV